LKIILASISLERFILLDDLTLEIFDVMGLYIWDRDQRLELEFEVYFDFFKSLIVSANFLTFALLIVVWTELMKS